MSAPGWWLPPDLRGQVTQEQIVDIGSEVVRLPVLSSDTLLGLARELRQRAAERLVDRPIAGIVETLDRAAQAWLDPTHPHRKAAEAVLPGITGFSLPMVRRSIDLEMRSSRAPHLWRVLRNELGDPAALDGFVDAPQLGPGGRTRAFGPGLVGAVFSSNIPALPHLSVMRALLLKSAFLGRSASAEPSFLPLYLETLWELDPGLAGCLGVLHWERGQSALTRAWLGSLDFFVGWGGQTAEAEFRAARPPGLPMIFHGHRLGLAIVGRGVLADPAARKHAAAGLAEDVATFDQHACLAPHVVYAEGDLAAARPLAAELALALADQATVLPGRAPDPGRLADLQQRRAVAEMDQAMGTGGLWVPDDGGPGWTVVLEAAARFAVSPLDRFVTVVPVSGMAALVDQLQPLRGLLQNVGVAVTEGRRPVVRESLARLGVSRICPPGHMGSPSMMWHHDGQPCVGRMVRWCDEEGVRPEEIS